jgi:hypothetical protein
MYVLTGVVTLYFNYVGKPSEIVRGCIYASLAITLISAGHYLTRVFPMSGKSV